MKRCDILNQFSHSIHRIIDMCVQVYVYVHFYLFTQYILIMLLSGPYASCYSRLLGNGEKLVKTIDTVLGLIWFIL